MTKPNDGDIKTKNKTQISHREAPSTIILAIQVRAFALLKTLIIRSNE